MAGAIQSSGGGDRRIHLHKGGSADQGQAPALRGLQPETLAAQAFLSATRSADFWKPSDLSADGINSQGDNSTP